MYPYLGELFYQDLYPGIAILHSSGASRLKSEFVVAPGADPSGIRIAYTGGAAIRVDEAGALIFSTPDGELREAAPEIYQDAAGRRNAVKGAFRISGDVVSFSVEEYDISRELRIALVFSYSTYVSGGGTNKGTAIAVDASHSAYVTGYTHSTNFPAIGEAPSPDNVDVFVTKLSPTGNAIVYSTYLGGSGDDRGFSIAVDQAGSAYVTGSTASTNFPVASALQGVAGGGGSDAFVAELNPTGTALVFCTYLGGAGVDRGNGIAIDGSGIYITGSTASANFPVAGAFQSALAGGEDGFVTKLTADGRALVYSTYLGGSLDDRGSSITVDSSGAAYISGNTSSTNFPIASALQSSNAGAPDAFVTKLSAAGDSLIYSTYLGGSGAENVERGRSIAVDSANNAYIAGTTASANFPTSQPLQASLSGGNDAFVVKLNATGTAFVYSTYLGGSSGDSAESIAVDSGGNAYVAGFTSSLDFPSTNPGRSAIGSNDDTFVAKLNNSGSAVMESAFLESGAKSGYGMALDSSSAAYLTGQTSFSPSQAKTPAQGSLRTNTLARFVAKVSLGTQPPAPVSVSPASGSGTIQNFSFVYTDPAGNSDIAFVDLLFQTALFGSNACYATYVPSSNVINLFNDAGTGSAGSATLGTPGTLSNSQCGMDTGASSVSVSGANLTLTLALTFKPAFGGAKSIYMVVGNNSNVSSGWQAEGAWTVPISSPVNVSASPASGSGAAQSFSFAYSDPLGNTDIAFVDILFQTTLSPSNACYAIYVPSTNTINLFNDAGTGSAGVATLGVAGTLSNSQCTIAAGASSVSASGANLTLTLALTFKPAFGGAKNIYMVAGDKSNLSSGWQAEGAWTVPLSPPVNVSVSPALGSGTVQAFSLAYSDPLGNSDIAYVDILFQTAVSGPSACYATYAPSSNVITLFNDAGTGIAGSATLGIAGALSNSQCTIAVGTSSVSASGANLTLTVALTFQPAFGGAKNIYMVVSSKSNATSGWQAEGAWTVPISPPLNLSVSPASGTGTQQNFSFAYSDPLGNSDIGYIDILFQTILSGSSACYAVYVPSSNVISLFNDAGTAVAGSATLGIAGTLSNSQCIINTGASSVSVSGSSLTLTVALTFQPAFGGTKNIYMVVGNKSNVSSGWQTEGAWTVATGQPVALTVGTGAAAPGGTVNIGISFNSSPSAQPAALQWTLSYSSTDISSLTVTPGSGATGAGKSIVCSSSPGSTICIVYGLNDNTIPNGSVAVASFVIAPGSTATSIPIQISGVVAATPAGNSTGASGGGGAITVN